MLRALACFLRHGADWRWHYRHGVIHARLAARHRARLKRMGITRRVPLLLPR